jgi:putative copper resistance protein D
VTLDPSTIAILTGATRAVAYAAATSLAGVVMFDSAVLRQASLPQSDRDILRKRARNIGLLVATTLFLAYAARLYIQVLDSYLVAIPTLVMLEQLIFLTRSWGYGVLGQLVISSILTILFFFMRRSSAPAAVLWLAAPLAALSVPLTGHAFSHGGAGGLLVQATHVLAAGSWLGTLAVLWWLCRNSLDAAGLLSIIRAFSPVALASAAMVALAGTAALFIHLDSPRDLVSTSYGLVLLVKITLFAAAASVGYVNWQHVTPSLARGGPRRQFTRAAALEISLGVMAILATALLTSLPQPGE